MAYLGVTRFNGQHDTRAVVKSIKECMHAHGEPGPQNQASDQP